MTRAMCRADDFPPYPDPAPAPRHQEVPPIRFTTRDPLRRAPRHPILAAADALGLPDCPPDCTCRGSAAEER